MILNRENDMLLHQAKLREFYPAGRPGALLWDLDGVLADTMMLHFRALQAAVEAGGLSFPPAIIQEGTGRTDRENLASILRTNGLPPDEARLQAILAAKEARFREVVQGGLEPAAGVLQWLEDARRMAIPCALASSAKREVIAELLGILDVADYFTAIVSGDELPRGKPDPEVFLRAAQALNVRPQDCLVIEDAVVGIQAAHAAGMRCIAVGTSYPLEMLAEGDIVVKDLTGVLLI
jgi:beta-phosphoglucomutase family hydrolase